MDSIEVNSERQSESYGTGEANVSLAGELTVPRPRPSEARAREVQVRDDWLYVELVDGRRLEAPLTWFPRLIEASARERQNYELIADGRLIHWPDVDEDIDVHNLLRA